ncbi:DNA-binding response regulator [Virgisporangium aliadipatigenens]|uniref:DNA-binding response regulator n=1 Tax=Virgisporangium aliadipatigenens TaxID=741659 RepID=A0A8J4DNL1_9ACTN|nr:response regulator transcription factor [Virgisporangium aliadipatigenens]GIJ43931.1 DNA-binding response regulator [Virgisporangium aliadipatigenens]
MPFVLVAEDNAMQAEVIRRYLEQDGHTTTVVRDGRAAIDTVRRERPDLVVLDVMMPHTDGLEVCRVLRRESDVPVLMLTARSTEDDLLIGLETGADDYLTKPYSPRELVARVRTLLRRAGRPAPAQEERQLLRAGGLAVDVERREVRVDGRPVECTPGEFEILAAMVARPGRVFTRQQLLVRTSVIDRATTERTVDVHVRNLRKKIEADPARPEYIRTVFGVGYKIHGG